MRAGTGVSGGPLGRGHRLPPLHDQLTVLLDHGVWRHGGDVSHSLQHPLDGDKDREELCGYVHGWPSGHRLHPGQPLPPPNAGCFCLPPRYPVTRHYSSTTDPTVISGAFGILAFIGEDTEWSGGTLVGGSRVFSKGWQGGVSVRRQGRQSRY